MTTFWRPIGAASGFDGPVYCLANVHDQLFALWARCDLCQASGPYAHFALWERQREAGTLCAECDSTEPITAELLADGWIRCE